MTLRSSTLAEVLEAFASNTPFPGGGSAAALAGALGTSLLVMVATLPKTRDGSTEDATQLAHAARLLDAIRERLTRAVDDDSEAYRHVVAALRLAKSTDEEKVRRRDAVQAAMRRATEVPLETLRACGEALRHARIVGRHGVATAASDVAVAIELLMAAARGSALNVDENLAAVHDAPYVARVRAERDELEATCRLAAGAADQSESAVTPGPSE